jgi:DNA topoisomerase-1
VLRTSLDGLDGAGGLHHTNDGVPGIRRLRAGRGFRYLDPEGRSVRDPETLARIGSLAVPPAWTDVWICRSPNGHLQATGRDARGRKQYRYHPRFRAARERFKYQRLLTFARVLPALRRRVRRDLRRRGLPREKVLATVVSLLERTLVRVGNAEYARDNRSFGLTTLRDRHARVRGPRIQLRFRGKGGRVHEVDIEDRRVARIVRRCQDLPGQDLFQYLDEHGNVVEIRSDDVNAYLREASGEEITAKDFRTWAGTLLAFRALRATPRHEGSAEEPAQAARRALVAAVRQTAMRLGNTATVCRRSYIHPAVLDAYADGRLGDAVADAAAGEIDGVGAPTPAEEREMVRLIRRSSSRRLGRGAGRRAQASGR